MTDHRITLTHGDLLTLLAYLQEHDPNNLGLIDMVQRWIDLDIPHHHTQVTTLDDAPSLLITAITDAGITYTT